MNNRDKIDVMVLVEAGVGLLRDINRIRHDSKSQPIHSMIKHIQAIMQPTSNYEAHLKEIRHLMEFELDPGFTKNEKSVIDDVLNKMELDILSRRKTNVFTVNDSNTQIMIEHLLKNSIQQAALKSAWNEVRSDLILEMYGNHKVQDILEIERPKPAAQPKPKQKSDAEIKSREIKSQVQVQSQQLAKAKQPPKSAAPSVAKAGLYKHKLSPRSEEQPLPPGKRNRK